MSGPSGKVRLWYTIGELAELTGESRYKVTQTLETNGVTIRRRGRVRVVFLSALKHGFPDLWESLLELQAMRRSAD
jgi:hypothetical protein